MPVWIVRDPLFGDGGKAKIVDYLSEDPEVKAVVRWQGGDNAGHTMVVNGQKIAVHAIPSGVVRAQERPVMSVMGRGMVINLPRVFAEIDKLIKMGINITPNNLLIAEGTHLTLPYHMALEKAREGGEKKKDTTARAICQTYGTARMYQGIRAGDVRDLDRIRELIEEPLSWFNAIIVNVYGGQAITEEEVMAEIESCRERLLPFLRNESLFLNQLLNQGKIILMEGAQSGMLDVDLGIYPHTTASNTWPGSIQSGAGISPHRITRDILVVKAYISRVGLGHLVAEIHDERADIIREKGGEYGTTTGRPRRIGWSDQEIAHYVALISISPISELAVTKLDILTDIDLEICTGYQINDQPISIFPTTVAELNACQPILKKLPRWKKDITGFTNLNELPLTAREYLEKICEPYGCRLSMVGTGPGRKQLIVI